MPPAAPPTRTTFDVIGTPIDALTAREAVQRIAAWAARRESRYVCICNAHSVVTARQDPAFAQVLREADMATPDGAPVAFMGRRQGHHTQRRVSGPDLMQDYLDHAEASDEPVFLYGATDSTLQQLAAALRRRWPALPIAGMYAPPFRPLSTQEDAAVTDRINRSGAATVWVALGCPKQEAWMAAHRGRIQAVMVGVGAAFDFHAGTVSRAPHWMQQHGLEWLHRLASEPRRLWKRYLVTNTRFVAYAAAQMWDIRFRA